jgi:signal transduction histidine kinase/CheY-like chemotaxis protein
MCPMKIKKPRKATFNTLLFVITFLLILIGTILYTQYYSKKNILAVREANQNAKSAFEINNRLQELIFHIESAEIFVRDKYLTGKQLSKESLKDTLHIVEGHLITLNQILSSNKANTQLAQLVNLVDMKMTAINNFIANYETLKLKKYNNQQLDDVLSVSLNDSLYNTALIVQQKLENDLKHTFIQTSQYSDKVLRLNTILSIIVILAVAILGTLIIKRLLDQLSLIYKLGKEKERADKSAIIKEQFLANMSHEIRTPINAVVGFANLLQKTKLEGNQKQFVDLIQNSGESLLSVVNDILDISKIEAGMMRITKNPFSLHEACTSIEMMFYHKIQEKQLDFSLVYDENIPDTIVGDAERLNQVLINLINNAIKFTNKGSVKLSVDLLQKSEKEATIKFVVTDSGIGISKEKLEAIFERFEQADGETSRQYGGTGLGLSIVEQIIKMQGGDVKVESILEVGTTFTVVLKYEYINKPDDIKNYLSINTMMKKEFKGYKALVAEDNKTNQTLLKFILQQWNLGYDLAENGVEALELLQKNHYDLVLMDIQMPIMDGYEASRKIRQDINAGVPIIAMTAHVLPTEKQKCIDAGMNDYISKPINEDDLFNLIEKYIVATKGAVLMAHPTDENEYKHTYIDVEYLNRIFSDNKEFINEIMYQFREQYPDELEQLKQNMSSKNKEKVLGLTHHMKTTVSVLSINTPLKLVLDDIEEYVAKENWQPANAELEVLLQAEPIVMREVDTVLTATKAS